MLQKSLSIMIFMKTHENYFAATDKKRYDEEKEHWIQSNLDQ
jgi:hypothetical protein